MLYEDIDIDVPGGLFMLFSPPTGVERETRWKETDGVGGSWFTTSLTPSMLPLQIGRQL